MPLRRTLNSFLRIMKCNSLVVDDVKGRMNWDTSTNPDSLFTNAIICTRIDYNDALQAVSRTILSNGVLKERKSGVSREITKFKTEDERIKALEEVFGITFSQEEKNAIKHSKLAVENLDPNSKSIF